MRTVIYVRLSVHRGVSDPSTSPQGQEEACRAYCAAQGWHVSEVVKDLDVSGAAGLKRPGLERLREIGAERVVFLKIDRIARNVADFLALAREFTLVSVKDNLDLSTGTGRFVATILAAFAELERDMIAGRVKDARAVLDAQGRFAGGVVPHGYRVIDNPQGNGKILEPHPDEAPLWQTAAEGILKGRSLHWITRYLNHKGVKPRKGDHLAPTTVRKTLTGEPIVGRKNGVQVWEPAIDLEVWAQVRGVFEARSLPQGRRRGKNARLLSPVMVCAGCGSPLWLKNDRGEMFARCSLANNGGDCPAPATVKYASLEALVLERVEEVAYDRPMVELQYLGSNAAAVHDAEAALEAAQARLRVAETPDEEEAALADRRAARAALEALNARTREPVLRVTGERVWDVITGEDSDAAARAVQTVVSAVRVERGGRGIKTLDPQRVHIEWAEYVEPVTVPRKIYRNGVLVNQAEIDRYEREHGPMPY
jgi:site-specific DNA recombinase